MELAKPILLAGLVLSSRSTDVSKKYSIQRELLYVIMEMYMYMRLATSRFPKDYLMRLLKNTEKVDIIKA